MSVQICPRARYTVLSLLSFDCHGSLLPSGTHTHVQLRSFLNAERQGVVSPEHPVARVKLVQIHRAAGYSKPSRDWQWIFTSWLCHPPFFRPFRQFIASGYTFVLPGLCTGHDPAPIQQLCSLVSRAKLACVSGGLHNWCLRPGQLWWCQQKTLWMCPPRLLLALQGDGGGAATSQRGWGWRH